MTSAAIKPTKQFQDIEVPLALNGFYLGDIAVRINGNGKFEALNSARFQTLMKTQLEPAALNQLRSQAGAAEFISASAAELDGLRATFDEANLQLTVTRAPRIAPVQAISLTESGEKTFVGDVVEPSGFSGALNLNMAKQWVQRSRLDPANKGLKPLTGSLDGYFNLGGLDGVYLYHQWAYDAGAKRKLQRGAVTLIHDIVSRGIRISAGDISPPTAFFQGSTQLGGIQIGTAYSEIQPNRNVRPAGHTDFVLDRTSRVDVEVNGLVVRTLTLAAGRYNLRDLSLSDGANDVRLMVEDATGKRELLSFSGLFSSELLAKGLSDFSIAFGFGRSSNGPTVSYHTGRPKLTGIIKRGLTDTLTAGANLQLDSKVRNIGAEVTAALPIGTLSAQLSGSSAYGHTGLAAATGFRLAESDSGSGAGLDLLWRYRSASFRGLDESPLRNEVAHEFSLAARHRLPLDVMASASLSYVTSRTRLNERRFAVTANRSFGKLLANLFVERGRALDGRRSTAFVGSLSLRLNGRSSLRAQYRSRTGERIVEYDRTSFNAVGEWSARTGYSSSHRGNDLQGSVDLYTNRGEFGFRSGLSEIAATGDQQVSTTFRAAGAIAFANGQVAVGRPVYDGFAIVSRHRTLRRNRITVPAGFGAGTLASTDFMGPALVPLSRAYQSQQLDVEVHDLPVGYNAGASRVAVFPGARSGVAITIGSDAVNSVLSTLGYADGEPVVLVAGILRRIEAGGAYEQPFFTNRMGRFAAEKLKPGTYRIILSGLDSGSTLTIPEDANGLVRLPSISVKRR